MKHLKILFAKKWILMFFFFAYCCYFPLTVMAGERFVDNGNGTITDTKTGLMWAAADNTYPISWLESVDYCKTIRTAGYTDWRMPTLAELQSIYTPNEKNGNGYHTSRLIFTTAESCWASDTEDYKAARFNFTYGKEYWLRQSFSGATRVLPVRTNK